MQKGAKRLCEMNGDLQREKLQWLKEGIENITKDDIKVQISPSDMDIACVMV